MKRSQPMRRTPLRRARSNGGPTLDREPKPWAPATLKPLSCGTYEGSTSGVLIEKTDPYRDRTLLAMAQGRPCLLLVPACCNHRIDTTCACHENKGKGMALKQSDERSVWGCAACHRWYDRSGASRETKRAVFDAAHPRQVLAWRLIAADPGEPLRFRRAAQRALDRLNATQGATA